MSGNKTMYMIFEKIIVYSKQIRESDKNVHEILENIDNRIIEMLTVQNLDRIMQKYNKKKEKLK